MLNYASDCGGGCGGNTDAIFKKIIFTKNLKIWKLQKK